MPDTETPIASQNHNASVRPTRLVFRAAPESSRPILSPEKRHDRGDLAPKARVGFSEGSHEHRVLGPDPMPIGRASRYERRDHRHKIPRRQRNAVQDQERTKIAGMTHEPIRPAALHHVIVLNQKRARVAITQFHHCPEPKQDSDRAESYSDPRDCWEAREVRVAEPSGNPGTEKLTLRPHRDDKSNTAYR